MPHHIKMTSPPKTIQDKIFILALLHYEEESNYFLQQALIGGSLCKMDVLKVKGTE